MKGFPSVFSTKGDFYNVREEFPDKVKEVLRRLMGARYIWVIDKEILADTKGIEDSTHQIIKTTVDEDGVQREATMQMKLVEDKNSEFYRLGWSVEEANKFLAYQPVATIVKGDNNG